MVDCFYAFAPMPARLIGVTMQGPLRHHYPLRSQQLPHLDRLYAILGIGGPVSWWWVEGDQRSVRKWLQNVSFDVEPFGDAVEQRRRWWGPCVEKTSHILERILDLERLCHDLVLVLRNL